MSKEELENWERVKLALEAAGKTDCMHKRAVAICDGKKTH